MEKIKLITDTAIELISEQGFGETNVQSIAQKANISVGTIYNYFKSKYDILNYIFMEEFQKRIKLLKALQECNKNSIDKIVEFLIDRLDSFHNNPKRAIVIAQEIMLHFKHMDKPTQSAYEKYIFYLKRIIEQGQENKEICSIDSNIIVSIIVGSSREILNIDKFSKSIKEYEIFKKHFIETIIKAIMI